MWPEESKKERTNRAMSGGELISANLPINARSRQGGGSAGKGIFWSLSRKSSGRRVDRKSREILQRSQCIGTQGGVSSVAPYQWARPVRRDDHIQSRRPKKERTDEEDYVDSQWYDLRASHAKVEVEKKLTTIKSETAKLGGLVLAHNPTSRVENLSSGLLGGRLTRMQGDSRMFICATRGPPGRGRADSRWRIRR